MRAILNQMHTRAGRRINAFLRDQRGDIIGMLIVIVITVAIGGLVISLAVPAVRDWWESIAEKIMEIFNFA